jgi:hypothetical protein
MSEKTLYKYTSARHLTAAFFIRLSISSLFEEVYQGHIGSPHDAKRIIRQTTWINDQLCNLQEYITTLSAQSPNNFCIILLEKSVKSMIVDCKNLGVLANQMALSRIHQRDSTKAYRRIRVLMNSVLQNSSQLYNQLKSLEMAQSTKASMN